MTTITIRLRDDIARRFASYNFGDASTNPDHERGARSQQIPGNPHHQSDERELRHEIKHGSLASSVQRHTLRDIVRVVVELGDKRLLWSPRPGFAGRGLG